MQTNQLPHKFVLNRKTTYSDPSRFYQNLTEDIVRPKRKQVTQGSSSFLPRNRELALYTYRIAILESLYGLPNQTISLLILISNTFNLVIIWHRNILPSVVILTLEKSYINIFITSLQLVTPIHITLQTSMRIKTTSVNWWFVLRL